jgi:hypothetical protein
MKKVLACVVFLSMIGYTQKSEACEAGGVGATTCSVSTSIGFLGLGGTRTVSTTCGAGYYACCSSVSANCNANPSGPPPESVEPCGD